MTRIATQHIKRSFLTLMLIAGISVFGFGQTFQLQSEANIKAAPGQPKYVTNENGTATLQATHELRRTVYVQPTGNTTRSLRTQTYQIKAYQRWFRYDDYADLPTGIKFSNGTLFSDVRDGRYYDNTDNAPTVNSGVIDMSIACDISRNSRNGGLEPVLSYRLIYDIRSAKEIADKLMATDLGNPLEYYEMIAPTDAQLLINPKYPYFDKGNFQSNYYVGSSSYSLTTNGTSGETGFYWHHLESGKVYSTDGGNAPSSNGAINNGSIYNGSILAVAPVSEIGTVHNWYLRNASGKCIAHFKITYEDKDTTVGPTVDGLPDRDEETLSSLYKLLITRNFDYEISTPQNDSNNAHINYKRFTGYPLAWDECSYGFTTVTGPTWSEYSFITTPSSSMGWCYNRVYDRLYNRSRGSMMGMMFYVDASEIQGTVSNLDISEANCAGTQLYISSWIMNANNKGNLGPNLNFEIVGIRANGEEEIMKCFTTGTMGVGNNTIDNGSEWHQIFFNATVPRGRNYTNMRFRIVNNQLNSSGNDYYIDDIQVYMMKPAVEAKLTAPMCGNSAVVTMEIDYDKMIDIVALSENTSNLTLPIGYSIVDKAVYERYMNGTDNNGEEVPVADRTQQNALNAARVNIVSNGTVDGSAHYFHFMLRHGMASDYFEKSYEEVPELNIENIHYMDTYFDSINVVLGKTKEKIFRKKSENGEKKLILQTQMVGTEKMPIAVGREYYVIFNTLAPEYITESDYNKEGATLLSDNNKNSLLNPANYTKEGTCDVFTSFSLIGSTNIELDGSTSLFYGSTEMCANTRPTFSVKTLTYVLNGEEKEVSTEALGLTFDWFKGSLYNYKDSIYYVSTADSTRYTLDKDNGRDPFSMKDALTAFRKYYYEAGTVASFDARAEYVPAMKAMLMDKTTDAGADAEREDDNTLLLFKKWYNPKISANLNDVNDFLAIPIASTINTNIFIEDDKNETPLKSIICLEAQSLAIISSGIAPGMAVGEDNVKYIDGSIVPIRITLSQISEVSATDTTVVNKNNWNFLKIPIQKESIFFSDSAFSTIMNVITTSQRYRQVVLFESNDPVVHQKSQVGELLGMINWMMVGRESDENYITIYFFKYDDGTYPVEFREGYEYTMKFFISEFTEGGADIANTCEGNVFVTMKIVPEYMIWAPQEGNRNWNNDSNWRRAEASEFYGPASYISNDANYTDTPVDERQAFVPLFSTKVIIDTPDNTSPYLADVLSTKGTGNVLDLSIDEERIGKATDGIQYELSVSPKEMHSDNKRYYYPFHSFYGNTAEEVYFKPDAMIMNPHYLEYDTARVDFTINTKRWYLLGTPMTGVVAGDMYTRRNGLQNTYAYGNICYNMTDNNRFAPAVYQRGWDKVSAMVIDFNNESNNPGVTNTSRNVAVKASWSSVYNDVAAQYVPGTGFSIKSVPMSEGETSTFRLPKGDVEFDYYMAETSQSDAGDKTNVSALRSGNGRLASDVLTTTDAVVADLTQVNVGNGDTGNKLYLLANPFMTHLGMSAFFAENTMFESKYWFMSDDIGGIQGGTIIEGGSAMRSQSGGPLSVAPMQGFFVELKEGQTANPQVRYTAAMMTDPLTDHPGLTRASSDVNELYITASRNGVTGTTALRVASEYAPESELQNLPSLFDSNWDEFPLIYTIGQQQAMQIQTVRGVTTVPLGIYSNSDEAVEVSFTNAADFTGLSLYDSFTDTSVPIDTDMTLMLPGSTNGRFLLTFQTSIGTADLTESITISSVERGSIWVTSDFNDPIDEIIVYDVNGRKVAHLSGVNHNSQTLSVDGGIYVVQVHTATASQTGKVMVRK